ncbi:hypothetical protein [Pseudomonas aeruginosa]|uniref:hypothetical protein n=1 Tax=Pseudomonas aeruginosa TaxID=287 RepID=UPI001B3448E5|nr:hypothetical protein [Pseudomonas aeruginosa]MBP5959856.1 hypothetical protein [Pseudomonas aeruginosa]MDE5268958.1 hypothetical protein [Pseudomonas aeruginosa]MDE5281919.1 hypothetical protein [Pseudomonas aeruginosa]
MSPIRTCSPIAKRTTETFVDHVNIGGERQRVEFQREVIWLQESETQLLYVHGGKILTKGPCHNDYYGYLTSLNPQELGALNLADHFSVDQQSALDIQLVTTVFLIPVHESNENKEHNRTKPADYRDHYSYIPDGWRYERQSDGHTIYPQPEREELGKEIVWSTQWSEEENLRKLEDFKRRWAFSVGQVNS